MHSKEHAACWVAGCRAAAHTCGHQQKKLFRCGLRRPEAGPHATAGSQASHTRLAALLSSQPAQHVELGPSQLLTPYLGREGFLFLSCAWPTCSHMRRAMHVRQGGTHACTQAGRAGHEHPMPNAMPCVAMCRRPATIKKTHRSACCKKWSRSRWHRRLARTASSQPLEAAHACPLHAGRTSSSPLPRSCEGEGKGHRACQANWNDPSYATDLTGVQSFHQPHMSCQLLGMLLLSHYVARSIAPRSRYVRVWVDALALFHKWCREAAQSACKGTSYHLQRWIQ